MTLLKINLFFFDEGEKTEKATPKKRQKAREEGQVVKSPDVTTVALFLGVFFVLKLCAYWMFQKLISVFDYSFRLVADFDRLFDVDYISHLVTYLFMQSLLIAMPVLLASMGFGLLASLAQVGWHITTKPLMPKLSKLNPISGFKRLFKVQALVDLGKSLVKFAIIIMVIYGIIKKELNMIFMLMDMDFLQAIFYLANLVVSVAMAVGAWFVLVAAFDFGYTFLKNEKELRMSKHEIKEEMKQSEGNPEIKGRIKSKMREISMRRMMQSVPQADVVITNPTHFAVALKYDRSAGVAPVVVAKGADFMAKRIKDKAKENGVEIVENKDLARTLYATVDIGREIPPELYQAVAEILAFVYRIKNKVS